jgi:acyl-CoA thioesterase FadM
VSVAIEVATSTTRLRPRFEGANIRTWIGFKHLMYLVEEAILDWYRQQDLGPQRLYHQYGLGLEIVDASVLLVTLLEVDDVVDVDVRPIADGRFAVTVRAVRGDAPVVLTAKIRVALVRERSAGVDVPVPPSLAPIVVGEVAAAVVAEDARPAAADRSGAFTYQWEARYFHAHYSERVQHSAYVRVLEEVVDRFLAARGLPIPAVLRDRGWIPVVSRARLRLCADAYMGETIETVFAVGDILKDVAYDGRMDCFVRRGDRIVPVATATILHGYAATTGPGTGRLVPLDAATVALLKGQSR